MQKNVRTAIKIIDYLIESHIRNSNGIRDLVRDWGDNGQKNLGISIASVHEDVAKALLVAKKYLEEKPNCKHPKKMQDTCKGKRYCMNCNKDLD